MLLRVEETIQQEVKAEGGGDAKDKAGRGAGGGRGEKETKEAEDTKQPRGKRGASQKDLRSDCETIPFLAGARTSEVIRTT